jgi:hypothetical protein
LRWACLLVSIALSFPFLLCHAMSTVYFPSACVIALHLNSRYNEPLITMGLPISKENGHKRLIMVPNFNVLFNKYIAQKEG